MSEAGCRRARRASRGRRGSARSAAPFTGYWNRRDFPDVVRVDGRMVHDDWTWSIDHLDEDNPDRGRHVQHFFNDHPLGGIAALALLTVGGVLAVRAIARG